MAGITEMADFLEQAIESRKVDRFPYGKLTPDQRSMLDEHLQAATRTSRNCESLRDPLELKYIREVATKLYAGLDLQAPTIYILDSPMACAFAWAHTPKSVAERWRVFHEEFYTHPLSSTITDMIADGYNACTRLVEHTIDISILTALRGPIVDNYADLGRAGELVSTAITSVKNPFQNAELMGMFTQQVNKHISAPAIRDSVQRQPIPNIETLHLPDMVFRGQHYVTGAYYQAMAALEMPFNGFHKNQISLYAQMNKACHWWFPYKHVLLLSDRHSALHLDDRGRPHNAKGAAIEYRDGWKVYAWKGIIIPREIVENPENLTVSHILNETNAEIRRAMVDVFGLDRFVVESNSTSLDKQGEYELLEVPYLNGMNMRALKMRCPTTSAVYVHSVHPQCTNVEQALAWKRGEDDFRNARPYKEGLIWEK
jgi:hypothetical protein